MKHRAALVAYEQSDGTYDLHRSDRLGRDLQEAWRITGLTPYGYSQIDEGTRLIEPTAIAQGWTFREIVDDLDYAHFSAVVRVSEAYAVTPYRALWFGLAESCAQVTGSSRIGNGVLVRLADVHAHPERDVALCGRFEAMKRTLGGLVDAGVVSVPVAREHLTRHVAGLEADRDVVWPSGMAGRSRDRSQTASPATGSAVLEHWLDPSTTYHGNGRRSSDAAPSFSHDSNDERDDTV